VPDPGDLATIEAKMARVVQSMERDFGHLKAAAASASLLDDIHVDHGGRRARLIEVASVTVPDPRQIVIQPWDPGSLRTIGTAISQSRIGLTPTIDGPAIRLDVPAMTEDRRREIVGLVHKRMDQARVEIRAVRHGAVAELRGLERGRSIGADEARRRTAQLQWLTDRFVSEIDRLGRIKEASLMHL
jgi:ribosome recycling factor